jgi:hypothetical protein
MMVVLVSIGVVLRARGIWFGRTIPLWEDEAAWAIRLIERPLSDHVLRAPGFMGLSKLLVNVFSASEAVLRFLPSAAGVGSVLIAPFVARRLFRAGAAQLVFVAILALHPGAIDLSKEFKPYSVALLLHLALCLVVLRYVHEARQRDLHLGIGLAFFGVLFSHDVVLAYPMVFGVMAFHALRSRRYADLIRICVGAGAALALLLVFYSKIADGLGNVDRSMEYWGNKYDVFFVHGSDQGSSRVGWVAARFYDLAGMLGMRRDLWRSAELSSETLASLRSFEAVAWAVVCGAGLVALVYQRRIVHAVVLVAPLLVLTAFNYFGYWPLGAFRTNLFTIMYFAGLAGCAFDWQLAERVVYWQLAPAFVLVVLPFLTLGRSSHARKEVLTAQGVVPLAAQELINLPSAGSTNRVLALDDKVCEPWRYYMKYHPARVRADELAQRFDAHCGKNLKGMTKVVRKALTSPDARAYMLAAGGPMEAIAKSLPKDLRIVTQKFIGQRDALVVTVALAPTPQAL